MKNGPELLKAYAVRTRRNQSELATYLSLTDAHLSQLLSRKRTPGLPTAIRIEDRTGVPARSWLETQFGRTGKRVPKRVRKPHISEVLTHDATS
jgi:transcriptional regulator with XRE-family HTH domain